MLLTFTGFDEAIVVDVETTGLSFTTDRIVSVSMLRVCFATLGRYTNYHRLVNTLSPYPGQKNNKET